MIDALRAGWLYLKLLVALLVVGLLFAIAIGGFVQRAGATWKPQYAQAPAAQQRWFNDAKVMPAARARLGFTRCCSKSDQVDAHFQTTTRDGREHWQYRPKGDTGPWRDIPDDIVHWDEPGYDGQAVLFALSEDTDLAPIGTLTCFFPPGGGT